jgi:hypothetical protein
MFEALRLTGSSRKVNNTAGSLQLDSSIFEGFAGIKFAFKLRRTLELNLEERQVALVNHEHHI